MMLKNKLQRHSNYLFFGITIVLLTILYSCRFKQGDKTNECYVIAGGSKILLFENMDKVKQKLLISKDIENIDTLISLYGFDEQKQTIDSFLITKQIGFFVDRATKRTIKEELYFDIESQKEGPIDQDDLIQILTIIKRESVPFLKFPERPMFDKSYENKNICCSYTIEILKMKEKPAAAGANELTINIRCQ